MEEIKEPIRTPEEDFLDTPIEDFNSPQYDIFLQRLFALGTLPDKIYTLNSGLRIALRILVPSELQEVAKVVDSCPGNFSKEITHKVEVISRALVTVNNQKLRFTKGMTEEWKAFRNTNVEPTDIEQQRFILKYRFFMPVIDDMFKKYQELLVEQEEALRDLKKN